MLLLVIWVEEEKGGGEKGEGREVPFGESGGAMI